jgi:hypothetical protein
MSVARLAAAHGAVCTTLCDTVELASSRGWVAQGGGEDDPMNLYVALRVPLGASWEPGLVEHDTRKDGFLSFTPQYQPGRTHLTTISEEC